MGESVNVRTVFTSVSEQGCKWATLCVSVRVYLESVLSRARLAGLERGPSSSGLHYDLGTTFQPGEGGRLAFASRFGQKSRQWLDHGQDLESMALWGLIS